MKATGKEYFILMCCLLFLYSCNHEVNHERAKEYLIKVTKPIKPLRLKVTVFEHLLNEAAIKASETEEGKLSQEFLDSLNRLFNGEIIAFDSTVNYISSIQEVDESLNLKQQYLEYLIKLKQIHETYVPSLIKQLTIGWNKPTEEEFKKSMETINKFKIEIKDNHILGRKMDELIANFQEKHKISADELKEYDLFN